MYLIDCLKQIPKPLKLFVDMDGVIADYDVGNPYHYSKKRPLLSNIKVLEEACKLAGVELYILSVSRTDAGVLEKNEWLDRFAPFFLPQNRIILSKESNPSFPSPELKTNYLKSLNETCQLALIDDDPMILKMIQKEMPQIILYKDTVLID